MLLALEEDVLFSLCEYLYWHSEGRTEGREVVERKRLPANMQSGYSKDE